MNTGKCFVSPFTQVRGDLPISTNKKRLYNSQYEGERERERERERQIMLSQDELE